MPVKGVIFVFIVAAVVSIVCKNDLLAAIKDLFTFTEPNEKENDMEDKK